MLLDDGSVIELESVFASEAEARYMLDEFTLRLQEQGYKTEGTSMRVYSVSDVHVGNHRRFGGEMIAGRNERCRMVIDALRRAATLVTPAGPLVVAGDLFDVDDPTPQIVADVMGALSTTQSYLIPGNHDMHSTMEGDDALGPLIPVVDQVFRKPTWFPLRQPVSREVVSALFVPFQPGPAAEWFPKAVLHPVNMRGDHNLLFFHLGVMDGDTDKWLKDANDAIHIDTLWKLMEELDIKAAFAGNWHSHKVWKKGKRSVVQCGALVPTGFDNPGGDEWYGHVSYYDTTTGKVGSQVISGPRFLKLDVAGFEALLAKDSAERLGAQASPNVIFAEIRCKPDQAQEIHERALEFREKGNYLAGFEVVPDDGGESQIAARDAAFQARSATSLLEAVSAYIEAMHLQEGVSRATVLELTKGFLA